MLHFGGSFTGAVAVVCVWGMVCIPETVGDAARVEPNQPADVGDGAADPAGGVAVANAAGEIPNQPADVFGAADRAGGVAVVNAEVAIPNQPADVEFAVDRAGGVAVANSAVGVLPNQPADVAVAGAEGRALFGALAPALVWTLGFGSLSGLPIFLSP